MHPEDTLAAFLHKDQHEGGVKGHLEFRVSFDYIDSLHVSIAEHGTLFSKEVLNYNDFIATFIYRNRYVTWSGSSDAQVVF